MFYYTLFVSKQSSKDSLYIDLEGTDIICGMTLNLERCALFFLKSPQELPSSQTIKNEVLIAMSKEGYDQSIQKQALLLDQYDEHSRALMQPYLKISIARSTSSFYSLSRDTEKNGNIVGIVSSETRSPSADLDCALSPIT